MPRYVKWAILTGVAALAVAVARTELEERALQAEAERRYRELGLPVR